MDNTSACVFQVLRASPASLRRAMATHLLASQLLLGSIFRNNATHFKGCSTIAVEKGGCSPRLGSWASSKAPYEATSRKLALQKGVLVEFQKDSGRILLGVTQNREGKTNWSVIDQNADTYIVRPNQINLIVPGADNYNPEDVSRLLRDVELLQDPILLEIAWEEMVSSDKTVNIEELALILYGSAAPEKCYSAYRLLATNPVYFKCKDDGYSRKYEPRSLAQVKELQFQKSQEANAYKGITDFADHLKSLMQLPFDERPTRSCWDSKEAFQTYLESLRAFALEMCKSPELKNTAIQVLEVLKVNKTPASVVNLLIQIGYFQVHENLHLLKLNLPMNFSTEACAEAEAIKAKPLYDVDMDSRVDLTALKVYTIDCDDPDEIDDGLSAVRLPDGRLKVWIHIADPTRWIGWKSVLQKEASQRCTSIYLPTMTISMLPKELGVDFMSLRQGQYCSAVSVSVTLSHDGSVAESAIQNSIIFPSYKLSYEAASELLSFCLEEEVGLSLLYQAALLRSEWRHSNGALDSFVPSVKVRVNDEQTMNPQITVYVEDQTSPSTVLVTEMMLLCGEVIAEFGCERGLSLPYKGQALNEEIKRELQSLPEGPARAFASFRCMLPAEMSFVKPLEHACLGLPGYVQFSSPLRRYADLLVHYQVKAALRGEGSPIPSSYLEASMAAVNSKSKILKRLQSDSERYWILEYLRREPRERKYRACLLRIEKDASAIVLLCEVGLQNPVDLHIQRNIGDEFFVRVHDSQPRKSFLHLKELKGI